MSHNNIQLDIPNVTIHVNNDLGTNHTIVRPEVPEMSVNVTNDLSTTRVIVRQQDFIVNQSSIPIPSGIAIGAVSSSYAISSSYAFQATSASFANVAAALIAGATAIYSNFSASNNLYVGNNAVIINTASAGLFSGSFSGNGSLLTGISATTLAGGTQNYIPLWATDSTLTSSLIYQTQSGIIIGATASIEEANPDMLGVYAGTRASYNLINAHGNTDSYVQINVQNNSSGAYASADIVATSDIGSQTVGYVDMGINSSQYAYPNQIGGPLDAYLYTTGSDLLIGNIAPDKRIIIFNGPGSAIDNARVYIDAAGTVGINTGSATIGAPEALHVAGIQNSYNLITAHSDVDDYSQINIKNRNAGNNVSSDIVATANNGDEYSYYVNMGINGENFINTGYEVGNANDAYVYSTGNDLYIGNGSPNKKVYIFAGTLDTELGRKLVIDYDNAHQVTGSLNISGSITTLRNVVSSLTASNAVTASYALNAGAGAGFPFSGSAVITGSLLVSGSGITGSLFGTSSWAASSSVAISSSFAISSSRAISSSFATTASAATSLTFVPTTASFATTASYAANADLLDGLTSTAFATTSSNTFIGNQIISGSLITTADTLIFTGSILTSGSLSVVGIITGSLFGTASVASNAITASYVDFANVGNKPTLVSSSAQINTGSFTGSFVGTLIGTSSWATTALTASYALSASYIDGGYY